MSSTMKFGLLALVSAAAAVPQHGGHSRFHKSGRPAYPTGGWSGANSTALANPTGPTGTGSSGEATTTIDETVTSTTTLFSTIFATQPEGGEATPSVSAGILDLTSSAAAVCGETITVTATNKVTVTVTPGVSSSAVASSGAADTPETPVSSSPPAAPSSSATKGYDTPVMSKPVEKPVDQPTPVAPSPSPSAIIEERPRPKPSTSDKPVEMPVPTPEPVSSTFEAPVSSAAPVPSSTPAPSSATPSSAAPSSAAPSPSAPSTPYKGGKRGLAYNDGALCSAFEGVGAWAYNWASRDWEKKLSANVEYVPMAWSKKETSQEWLKNVDSAYQAGSRKVMGFNECDHPEQCNLSPEAACADWKTFMDPIKSKYSDMTIMGPSVTNAGDKVNWGLDWLKNFQNVCPEASWDVANIHFYDIWQDNEYGSTLKRFQAQIEKAHEQTGKPVCVTEFGLNAGSSPADAATFLKGALEYLDSADIVACYSYFMVGSKDPMQLNSGAGLSEIGKIYAS